MKLLKRKTTKVAVCMMVLIVGIITAKSAIFAETRSEIESGKTYTGQIDSDNTSDEYTMVLQKSGRVSFIINVTDALDLKIYDTDGNKLDPYFHFGSGEESASINLKQGKYVLKICRYAYCNTTYTFTTTFKSANETFSYKNDVLSDVSSKAAIPFRTKINCQLAMNENCDYYKINIPRKGKLTLNLVTNIGQAEFSLLNSDGKSLDKFYGYSSTKQYEKVYTLAKGTYYLVAEKTYRGSVGTYNFKLIYSDDAISNCSVKKSSAKALTVTTQKAGSISGYEIKYRKKNGSWKSVTIKKGGDLKKTISNLTKHGEYNVKIRTYYTYKQKNLYSDWSKTKTVKL